MDLWIDQVQKKMGRKSAMQGPQGTISAKSRQSVEILIESLSSMKDFFHEVNTGFQSYLKLAATLPLALENFYSQMRSRNDMPTGLPLCPHYSRVPKVVNGHWPGSGSYSSRKLPCANSIVCST